MVQNGGMRVWEATVPGVELRPIDDLTVYHATLIMRGIELNVRRLMLINASRRVTVIPLFDLTFHRASSKDPVMEQR